MELATLREPIRLNLFLADFAQVYGGKLFVYGGGICALVQATPASIHNVAICGSIVIPWGEMNREHLLRIELFDEDYAPVMIGTPRGTEPMLVEARIHASLPPRLPRGSSLPLPFAIQCSLQLDPGIFHFRMTLDGVERPESRITVTVLGPPTVEGRNVEPRPSPPPFS